MSLPIPSLFRFVIFFSLCSLSVIPFSSVHAQIVLTVTGGQAVGSGFYQLQNAFDAQPTYAGLPSTPPGTIPGSTLGANVPSFAAVRQGYIDFGAGFASLQINQIWTAYRQFSNYAGNMAYGSLWWSNNTDNDFDTISDGDIAENRFNFGTQAVSGVGSITWTRDYTGLTITPPSRYLIVQTTASGFAADRATEFAIVGTTVPEPTITALIACALLCFVITRRSRNSHCPG